jgi:hypothetical protein
MEGEIVVWVTLINPPWLAQVKASWPTANEAVLIEVEDEYQ